MRNTRPGTPAITRTVSAPTLSANSQLFLVTGPNLKGAVGPLTLTAQSAFTAAGVLSQGDPLWPLYYGLALVVSSSRVYV